MTKKVAFVGFGSVQGTDLERVARALGVDATQGVGFFGSINEAAQFVVTKVNGKVTAIEGSEVYVSADADDDTISKAKRVRSVGVAVKLDWEPFTTAPYTDSALNAWLEDGEWVESEEPQEPVEFAVPSYVDDTPDPVFEVPTFEVPTEPDYQDQVSDSYAEAVPQFEAPSDVAPLPFAQDDSNYADSQYSVPEPQYAADSDYEGSQYSTEVPVFENSQYNNYSPEDVQNYGQQDEPQYPSYVEPEGVPAVEEPPTDYLDDAQEQPAGPAPMASFLTPGGIPPVFEEPVYEGTQYTGNEPQYNAPEEEPTYYAPEEPTFQEPQYEAPAPQEQPQQFEQRPPVNAPAPTSAPSYSPPTQRSSFIQESPNPAPTPSQFQRERAMFDQMPAGSSNDFESRTGGKIIYVTGSHGGAGKTTTAWTLASLVAVSMKRAGNEDTSVWLIESDYRNSKLAQRHNIDPDRTSGHLASMLEWLNDQSGIVSNLPALKAKAIAESTHRLENGLNIIACPYDTTKRDTKYIQQAVFQAAQYAKMQGGIVFIDADTISNDDIMDSKLAKAADRVVIVSDAGVEHIDDLKRAARILTTPVISGGLGVSMPAITVLLNKTGPAEFKAVEDSGVLAPLALGGYLPFIPEWATGWVGSLTNTDTFQNAVVLFARFFNGIVPLEELHQWSNYRAVGNPKKGGGWIRRIFTGRKGK